MQWKHRVYSVSIRQLPEVHYHLQQKWRQSSGRGCMRNLMPNLYPNAIPFRPWSFSKKGETPINVRINDANDMAMRLWYSISNSLILANPRCRCLLIYSLNCGLVIISCWFFIIRKSAGSMKRVLSIRSPLNNIFFHTVHLAYHVILNGSTYEQMPYHRWWNEP